MKALSKIWWFITEAVMNFLDQVWVKPYLTKAQGGREAYKVELKPGVRVEFVARRSRIARFLAWRKFDPQNKEEAGLPPFLLVVATLLIFGFMMTVAVYWMLTGAEDSWIPNIWWFLSAGSALALLFILIYWVYEWIWRREYWFQTTEQGYLVCFWPFGRKKRPISPLKWMKETIVTSVGAQGKWPMTWLGGMISTWFGVDDLLLGSLAFGSAFYDFLSWWKNALGMQEILSLVVDRGERLEAFQVAIQKKAHESTIDAFAQTGEDRHGQRDVSPVSEARKTAKAIGRALAQEFPDPGGAVDLADYHRWFPNPTQEGSSEWWDLETGELLSKKAERGNVGVGDDKKS